MFCCAGGTSNPSQALAPLANGTPAPHPENPGDTTNGDPAAAGKDKTLEDYEADAMGLLASKGGAMKRPCASPQFAKPKVKQMKRPAAAKHGASKPTASKDVKAGSMTKQVLQAKMCWGCTRCYGNPRGCSSCRRWDFQGVRLTGKSAWQKYKDKQNSAKQTNRGKSKLTCSNTAIWGSLSLPLWGSQHLSKM